MNTWLASTRDTFKTQLWPAPVIAVVAALLFGIGLPQLDATIDGDLSGRVNDWLFGGDADAARSLLGAIASSLITVTALTFSLTVVTLQLASSQPDHIVGSLRWHGRGPRLFDQQRLEPAV